MLLWSTSAAAKKAAISASDSFFDGFDLPIATTFRESPRKQKRNIFLFRQAGLWNLSGMSDEPQRLSDGVGVAELTPRGRIENHVCEFPQCARGAPFGFAKPGRLQHWICLEHRSSGDRFL